MLVSEGAIPVLRAFGHVHSCAFQASIDAPNKGSEGKKAPQTKAGSNSLFTSGISYEMSLAEIRGRSI